MQTFFQFCYRIGYNVRRYVALAQLRGGMCFCRLAWRAQSFSKLLMVIRGKNHDTKRESPAGAGAACAASHRTVLFSQKILAAQKPMTYTDLLAPVNYFLNTRDFVSFLELW